MDAEKRVAPVNCDVQFVEKPKFNMPKKMNRYKKVKLLNLCANIITLKPTHTALY